ncbi:lysosome membrane protein 2c [Triplophysa rosa]|uniref:Lysosome membrane protein 2 n=1 Tax=Triplophysa rosa TaxID=992332 RepID=A0A9W7WFZ4_TRIRA|nr:lysosome membrane protein 2c [Triplophysa rosa]KAI7796263.1 lysosome membrane protein 2 [Triplophysa rosa]
MRLKSCCVYSVGVVCILLLIGGIAMVLSQVFQKLINNRVKQEIVLVNGTEAFSVWQNPPPPVYMQFYLFNLTNPAEVLDGAKPSVVQIGPYTYREYRSMEEVKVLENGTKVAAINPKTYVFVPNMSRGSEDDLVRTANIPAVTVMEKFQDHSVIGRLIADLMRSMSVGVFGTFRVGDLLWGYEDPLLKALKLLVPLDDHFGLFYKRNGTSGGDYEFLTGTQNYLDFARIDKWNGQSSLNWWSTDDCNMINGTDGASFHPIITKTEKLYMFSTDLCRSLYAVYESDVSVQGVPGFRFVPPSEVFANITINPDNAGFCVTNDTCVGSGLLNISVCKEGAPIIMSSPHFYQADDKYVQDVYGMNPRKEEHETAIDINPLTGLLLRAAKRLQVNVFLEQMSVFSQTEKIRTLVYPVMYINESVVIDEESAEKLQVVVTEANVVINIPFIVIGLGILLGVAFIVLICHQKGPQSTAAERQPLLAS